MTSYSMTVTDGKHQKKENMKASNKVMEIRKRKDGKMEMRGDEVSRWEKG